MSAEASVGDLQLQTYNVIRKHRKEKVSSLHNDIHRNVIVTQFNIFMIMSAETRADEPQDTQAAVTEQRRKTGNMTLSNPKCQLLCLYSDKTADRLTSFKLVTL